MENKKTEKKPKSMLFRIISIFIIAIVLILIGVVVLGLNLLNRISRPVNSTVTDTPTPTPAPVLSPSITEPLETTPEPSPSATPEPVLPLSDLYPQTKLAAEQYDIMAGHNFNTGDYINILLLGVDRRDSDSASRSDTMMIATVDKKNSQLKLTSIMRDLLVEIPGKGYGKLNTASVYGGPSLLMDTIEHNFHIDLQYYVLVDFKMFEQIIDEMGGITVKMSTAEISAANDCIAGLNKQWGVEYLWDGFIFAEPGNVKLTGKQALGFARIRHLDSDFKRIDRQFNVLNAAYALFRSKPLTKQYKLMYDLLPLVETNMDNTGIISAAVSAFALNANGLVSYRLPVDDSYKAATYNRSYVILSDLTLNAWAAHQMIFENVGEEIAAKVLKPGASLPPRTPNPSLDPLLSPYPWMTWDPGGSPDPAFTATPDPNLNPDTTF